jgi:hypothetical protein
VDYKAFLSKAPVEQELPFFGGTRVDTKDRRLRLEIAPDAAPGGEPLAPGWYRFKIDGRTAVPKRPAKTGDVSSLPAVRGHFVSGWIVVDGRTLHRIALPPDDEPAPLSRIVARRWYSGDVLFDSIEFEDDAELAARAALEERRALGDTKGVVPSLRAAFAYAVGMSVAAELNIGISPRELRHDIIAIADRGRDAVTAMFHQLLEQRRREAEETQRRIEEAAHRERLADTTRGARTIDRHRDPVRRADEVLERAGARMMSARRLAGNSQLDVIYEVDGNRIMSIIDIDSFQVVDPGVCLAGAHRVLTLDAMPSVVREAIEEDHLNITRR